MKAHRDLADWAQNPLPQAAHPKKNVHIGCAYQNTRAVFLMAEKEQIISTLSQRTDTFIKVAQFKNRRRWYESISRQGDVQATVVFFKDPFVPGFILEGRYGKLSTHGKIGQHQIERGELLLESLVHQVRSALQEADWRVARHDAEGMELWERVDPTLQSSDQFVEKPD